MAHVTDFPLSEHQGIYIVTLSYLMEFAKLGNINV